MTTPIDPGSTVTTPIRTFFGETPVGLGTGFFMEARGQTFLVTNWHVVAGRHFETLKVLHDKSALPDRLTFLASCRGSTGEWMEVDCPLYDGPVPGEGIPRWLEHVPNARLFPECRHLLLEWP